MINTLVALFRAAIVLIFGVLLLAVFSLLGSSGGNPYGPIVGIGALIFGVLSLGIAATLIAINDNLSKLVRASRTEDEPPIRGLVLSPTHRTYAVVGVGALVALFVAAKLAGAFDSSVPVEPPSVFENRPDARSDTRTTDSECDPQKAASVGLTCEGNQ